MTTPHISVSNKSKIAKTVIMPGDPLRAKFIAEKFLDNVELITSVRGMLGYTGTYKGRKITVMGSGMGMASIGIYSYELFQFYYVENIVRVGSAGSYSESLNLYDVVLVSEAYSESSYALAQSGETSDRLKSNECLNNKLKSFAKNLKVKLHEEVIHSSDVFYRENFDVYKEIRDTKGCMAVEMEAFALFANAKVLGKKASCLLTISDSLVTKEKTSSEEREKNFSDMIKVALELAQ